MEKERLRQQSLVEDPIRQPEEDQTTEPDAETNRQFTDQQDRQPVAQGQEHEYARVQEAIDRRAPGQKFGHDGREQQQRQHRSDQHGRNLSVSCRRGPGRCPAGCSGWTTLPVCEGDPCRPASLLGQPSTGLPDPSHGVLAFDLAVRPDFRCFPSLTT